MTDEESLLAAIYGEVVLQAYNPAWPQQFAAERDRLLALSPQLPARLIDIQHIGSTAVPGLAAKPVIDLLAGVESMAAAEALAAPLCANGYTTSAEFNAALTDRKWFMRWRRGMPRSRRNWRPGTPATAKPIPMPKPPLCRRQALAEPRYPNCRLLL